jgi:peptide deformylase
MNNDEVIVFDTESALKTEAPKVEIPTFMLVPETDPILGEVMPEFSFEEAPINPNDFASSLVETCKMYRGYGLSANQCGFKYRVFVMGTGDDYIACFNPKVVKTEGSKHMEEGCLSYPFLGLSVTRPEQIWVEYQDFNGEKREAHYTGITARVFLHELDHMNGIVYTSRAKPLALQMSMKKRNKYINLIHKQQKAVISKQKQIRKLHANAN